MRPTVVARPGHVFTGRHRRVAVIVLAAVTLLAVGGLAVDALGSGDPSSLPAPPPDRAPGSITRVTATEQGLTDVRGRWWAPAKGWDGGHLVHNTHDAAGTATPALYATTREGLHGYHQSLPGSGTYAVALYLADGESTAAHQRVFDVTANGTTVASGVDVFARVGRNHADHLLFTVAVAQRSLDLGFIARVGKPAVAAIEVAYLGPSRADRIAWSDEFDGPAGRPVDPARWGHETGSGGWGNNELETYTADAANAHLDGKGNLAVVAIATTTGGRTAYTSARLVTQGKASFTYGRISARVKLPVGRGLWPGFWALGTDINAVGYPRSGEIDVLENNGEAGVVIGKLHGPASNGATSSIGTGINTTVGGRYANYSALWTPIGVSFSVDGRTYYVAVPADVPTSAGWVFDKPFYLLLNLAVGGSLPGAPDANTRFPAEMLVDYVRVVQW